MFDVVNVGTEDLSTRLFTNNGHFGVTSFYDSNGERHIADRVVMGSLTDDSSIREQFPANVPRRASVVFANIPGDVAGAVRLEIGLEDQDISFANVDFVAG